MVRLESKCGQTSSSLSVMKGLFWVVEYLISQNVCEDVLKISFNPKTFNFILTIVGF